MAMETVLAVGAIMAIAGGTTAAVMANQQDNKFPDTPASVQETGKITEEEAGVTAKKRLYRSGVMFTSPTGLGGQETLASGRLK